MRFPSSSTLIWKSARSVGVGRRPCGRGELGLGVERGEVAAEDPDEQLGDGQGVADPRGPGGRRMQGSSPCRGWLPVRIARRLRGGTRGHPSTTTLILPPFPDPGKDSPSAGQSNDRNNGQGSGGSEIADRRGQPVDAGVGLELGEGLVSAEVLEEPDRDRRLGRPRAAPRRSGRDVERGAPAQRCWSSWSARSGSASRPVRSMNSPSTTGAGDEPWSARNSGEERI